MTTDLFEIKLAFAPISDDPERDQAVLDDMDEEGGDADADEGDDADEEGGDADFDAPKGTEDDGSLEE